MESTGFLNLLFKDIKKIVGSSVIKYTNKAAKYETLENRRSSDKYISAMTQTDSYQTYISFSDEAYHNAGIYDVDVISSYNQDKTLIPYDKRDRLVEEQRKIIIRDYVEQNNYYRMLNGQPDVEDFEDIFVDASVCITVNISPSIPIHQLDDSDIVKLNSIGYLDELITKYPTKKYLQYLGSNRIDIVTARTSLEFSLLKFNKEDISSEFYDDFIVIYEQCREYFLTVLYIKEYALRFEMYDNFMALMIMVMTIQRMISLQFKNGIEKDFYDLDIIKLFFDSYNVPFIDSLNLEQQRTLMRNLNNLLRLKSTDKVIFDICKLLGYERIQIFKYLLVKEHKLDENENPIFVYKDIIDEFGQTQTVQDNEAMYNIYFKPILIDEKNTSIAMSSNTNNSISYLDMVSDDTYWWDDENLKEKIYETEFNYIQTKYMGLNVMYKMSNIMFELSYALKMLIDKKQTTDIITLKIPKIVDTEVSLFESIIFLFALLSKKNGFRGNILNSPTKIMSVQGFNFSADFDAIKNFINQNSKTINPSILRYIENLNPNDATQINNLFANIRGLNDFLIDKLYNSKDIKEYRLYKQLYDTMMYSDNVNTIFQLADGTMPETYLEYLQSVRPDLAEKIVNSINDTELINMMEHTIYRLNQVMYELKYINYLNEDNNTLMGSLYVLLNFFKSYTVDLSTFNIIYLMNSRLTNVIKMVDSNNFMHKVNEKNSPFRITGKDKIASSHGVLYDKNGITLAEPRPFDYIASILTKDFNINKYKEFVTKEMEMITNILMQYNDNTHLAKTTSSKDSLGFGERVEIKIE